MRIQIKGVGIQIENLLNIKSEEDIKKTEIFSHLSFEEQKEAESELLEKIKEYGAEQSVQED